ncbi:hypothetical protein H6F77_23005 [Microcoleus sp. FACHB-831]|jgi:hypothetical protein|uniref:hypothetical protein n=1 Tax=Microcoleus sp. FACHB-831 TaxID=2692827 RepID=UPI001685D111|nr:hypothetical protein [Microcoleus sp. FACHB-831]MBD1923913.1 hypothetical protein [Microcoleus sp. FACHB-831]
MAVSDEFKEQLKAGKIVDALTLALGEAIELEITTWVSSGDTDTRASSNPDQPLPGYRMRTRINIVEGDINNEVGTQFIGNGPYTELRQFHQDQVNEGRETIQKNLATLQQLFTVMASTLAQLQPVSRRRNEGNPALSPTHRENLP